MQQQRAVVCPHHAAGQSEGAMKLKHLTRIPTPPLLVWLCSHALVATGHQTLPGGDIRAP
jgi:hypothetical protein